MRYDPEHKARTRARIVESAARQIRSKGPDKVAVADLMAGVGLTHGGFYAHFASKDDLIAEAVEAMFAEAQRRNPVLDKALADESANVCAALRGFLATYLSPDHRDEPARGCPLPALASEVARHSGSAASNFALGLAQVTGKIEAALERLGVSNPGGEARALVAQMVGAVALARAIGKGPQSDAILQDSLAALTSRLGL